MGKFGICQKFLLVFWGRGLLCWFSGVLVQEELQPLAWGPGSVYVAPELVRRGWKWWCPDLQPWSWKISAPIFSGPSRKSSWSLLSPWFPYVLCVHPDYNQAFLCFYLWHITPFRVSKLQILAVCICATLPGEGRGGLLVVLPFASPPPHPTPDGRVVTWLCSGWQFMATSSRKAVPGLPICNWFLCSHAGGSAVLRYPHSFCDPRDSETPLSYLGFCPALPPECLLGKLLKVLMLRSAAYDTFP